MGDYPGRPDPARDGELLTRHGLALSRRGWRDQLECLAAMGATEVAYQPAGPDIPRELEALAAAAHG